MEGCKNQRRGDHVFIFANVVVVTAYTALGQVPRTWTPLGNRSLRSCPTVVGASPSSLDNSL